MSGYTEWVRLQTEGKRKGVRKEARRKRPGDPASPEGSAGRTGTAGSGAWKIPEPAKRSIWRKDSAWRGKRKESGTARPYQ